MVIDKKYSHHKLIGTHCWYCDREFSGNRSLYSRPGGALQKTVDHIMPLTCSGDNTGRNKIGCCNDCNTLKGSLSLIDFAKKLLELKRKRIPHPMFKFLNKMINRCWKLYNKYDNKAFIKRKSFK